MGALDGRDSPFKARKRNVIVTFHGLQNEIIYLKDVL